jgi:hypothetical protein
LNGRQWCNCGLVSGLGENRRFLDFVVSEVSLVSPRYGSDLFLDKQYTAPPNAIVVRVAPVTEKNFRLLIFSLAKIKQLYNYVIFNSIKTRIKKHIEGFLMHVLN